MRNISNSSDGGEDSAHSMYILSQVDPSDSTTSSGACAPMHLRSNKTSSVKAASSIHLDRVYCTFFENSPVHALLTPDRAVRVDPCAPRDILVPFRLDFKPKIEDPVGCFPRLIVAGTEFSTMARRRIWSKEITDGSYSGSKAAERIDV